MSRVKIGRLLSNQIVINDASVSKIHASIFEEKGSLFIEDHSSTNGTFVNGKKINAPTILVPGDKVVLGNYPFDWEKSLVQAEELPEMVEEIEIAPDRKKYLKLTAIIFFTFLFLGVVLWKSKPDNVIEKKEVITKPIEVDIESETKKDVAASENNIATDKTAPKEKWNTIHKKINYNISCFRDGSFMSQVIGIGNEIESAVLSSDATKIEIEEEYKIGDEVLKELKKQYKFIGEGSSYERIINIFNSLIAVLPDSSVYSYKIYLMKSEEINAFTVGGKIFITNGIVNFSKSSDELAMVIGHEIYHNELGHIRKKLQKQAIAKNMIGDDLGNLTLLAADILTMSFNQENEIYSDLYGLDLAVKAGYEGCASVPFWKRMDKGNDDKDDIDKMLTTHPFSNERVTCLNQHIKSNYNVVCLIN